MTIASLSPQHLPTPREERWKYTNLPRAIPAGLQAVDGEDIVIHRTRGQNGGQVRGKIEDILFTGVDNALQTPRLKIHIEAGAELTVIERHDGQGAYWKNMSTEITVEDGARLRHIRIQQDSGTAVQTNMVHITLGRDATYEGFSMNIGAKLFRHDIHALVTGPGSHASFDGINLLAGAQHGDTTILIEHQAPNCTSNQFYRSLLDDTARGVFQGKVHVHQAAQRTDAYQLSNAILLSPRAEMDTKPELEIYADDVKCSHGATTGQLDDAPLFYLRSRGLGEREARLLLIQAFVDEVVDKIADEAVQNEFRGIIIQWLNQRL
ncbi:MAG: Fe-S cluster assembly protein SufD [Alphaproteobacteria bacterium]|nr:Fe-S cluster assembly protein SufD [Alphaproteobacteria bacterium]